jgi:hypothetical protein
MWLAAAAYCRLRNGGTDARCCGGVGRGAAAVGGAAGMGTGDGARAGVAAAADGAVADVQAGRRHAGSNGRDASHSKCGYDPRLQLSHRNARQALTASSPPARSSTSSRAARWWAPAWCPTASPSGTDRALAARVQLASLPQRKQSPWRAGCFVASLSFTDAIAATAGQRLLVNTTLLIRPSSCRVWGRWPRGVTARRTPRRPMTRSRILVCGGPSRRQVCGRCPQGRGPRRAGARAGPTAAGGRRRGAPELRVGPLRERGRYAVHTLTTTYRNDEAGSLSSRSIAFAHESQRRRPRGRPAGG